MTTLADTMQALVTLPGQSAGIRNVPIPEPDAGQIRVRVKAVALNPVDALYVAKPAAALGRTVGSDFAGVVDKAGDDLPGRPSWSVGDRVAGFLHGACQENDLPGAFAQFLVVDSDLVYGIPSNVSFEEAATIPLTANTASNGLFRVLGLPPPWTDMGPESASTKRPAILIYSGATSVGCFTIQLARLSPGKPFIVTTASLKNSSLLKSLGADLVLDYRSETWVEDARVATSANNGTFVGAIDCISEGDTVEIISNVFEGKGKIAAVRGPTQWSHEKIKSGVEAEYMAVWTLLGKEFWYNGGNHFPAEPTHRALAVALYSYISTLNPQSPLRIGALRGNSVRRMEGGLENIPEAFPLLGSGRVTERVASDSRPISGEKLVYRVEN